MDVSKENLAEMDIGNSVESFQRFVDTQREIFHRQVDQLQNIVVTQCKLTGVNPLSQEMAAGALSINIGKRPRDLLNPKAVKYMQTVFSIKDSLNKKESREISALFGITVTQVRDFFASQRSRVRRLVRLSREKAIRSNACNEPPDALPISSDPMIPIESVPLNSVGPISVEKVPSCSPQDDALPGIDDLDKHFVENIFGLMRKEETFSGQTKLMEWILQMQNPLVLNWLLTKGGVMILATWLSQAAIEEQTSVLLIILKVLCHLPLHKALPEHMSAILQSVNRLRFYRTPDVSNRARVLLSKWSKLFARSQSIKKPNGMKSSTDVQSEIILKQSIGEIMGDESWRSTISEEILAPSHEGSENLRKLESPQALKLLPASSDDSARKHILGVSSSHNRERRKVQLVEQPGQKLAGRSPQATRAVPASQGRPLSADDIQKAKMRALHMQSKYGKISSSSNGSNEVKPEGSSKPSTAQASIIPPVPKVHVRPKVGELKKPVIFPLKISNRLESPLDPEQKMDKKEPSWENCKRVQIPWQTPPEMKHNDLWRVGAGENSKEIEVQKNRIRREMETIYRAVHEIPSNPKEPWDVEMDYDDSLTPEIPTEQPPDADNAETQVSHNEHVNTAVVSAPASSQIGTGSGSAPEPDLELLAVLLKNPELVFALTSGQAGNLSSEETVKLLDMIKTGGAGLASNLNGFREKVEEKVEVSLPSPTPSSNPGTSVWRPEVVRNPLSQHSLTRNRVAYSSPEYDTSTNITPPQRPVNASTLSQHLPAAMPPFSLPQTTTILPDKPQSFIASSTLQSRHTNSPNIQKPTSEMVLTMENRPVSITSTSLRNLSSAIGPSLRVETISNVKRSPVSERQPVSFPMPHLLLTPARLQTQQQPPLVSDPMHMAAPYSARPSTGNGGPVSDSWRERQGFISNSRSQANQVNQSSYNASFGGPVQPRLQSGPPPWEGNEYVGEGGFESWSPDNSPSRSPEYMPGRNFLEPRMNSNWNYRPDRSRQRHPSGQRDYNRQGNKRWRDRRH